MMQKLPCTYIEVCTRNVDEYLFAFIDTEGANSMFFGCHGTCVAMH